MILRVLRDRRARHRQDETLRHSEGIRRVIQDWPGTYVDQAKRALLEALPRHLSEAGMTWDTDDDPLLFDLYVLLVLTSGPNTTSAQVHNAWAVATHRTNTTHPALIPFGLLTPDVQAYDVPFRDAIRVAALALPWVSGSPS